MFYSSQVYLMHRALNEKKKSPNHPNAAQTQSNGLNRQRLEVPDPDPVVQAVVQVNPLVSQVLPTLSSLPSWWRVQRRGWTRPVRHCSSDDLSQTQRRGFRASRPARTARRFESSSLPVRCGVGRARRERVHAGAARGVRSIVVVLCGGRGVGVWREERS